MQRTLRSIIESMADENPWVVQFRRNPGRTKLLCFHHSGGGASGFRRWAEQAEAFDIHAVQLPGRETRISETPYRSVGALIPDMLAALSPVLEGDFAFFGHSMGAILAYELALALEAAGRSGPRFVAASAHRAPHLPDEGPITFEMSDEDFIAELEKHNPTVAVLRGEPELMELVLPINRADAELCETYAYEDRGAFARPLLALGGKRDELVAPDKVRAWAEVVEGPFELDLFDGDHFYHQGIEADVMRRMAAFDRKL